MENGTKKVVAEIKKRMELLGIRSYKLNKLTGISPTSLNFYFRYKADMSLTNFIKICEALGFDLLDWMSTQRFMLRKPEKDSLHQLVDKETGMVVSFEMGRFSDTHNIVNADKMKSANYARIPETLKAMREFLGED